MINSPWIPIKDLPQKEGPYLVFIPSADPLKPFMEKAWYDPRGFGWSLIPDVLIKGITDWMPMPPPPPSGETKDTIYDYARKRSEAIENYCSAYLRETGLKVNEIRLVERKSNNGLRIEWYCEPKTEEKDK
jgi:hypothetical protein